MKLRTSPKILVSAVATTIFGIITFSQLILWNQLQLESGVLLWFGQIYGGFGLSPNQLWFKGTLQGIFYRCPFIIIPPAVLPLAALLIFAYLQAETFQMRRENRGKARPLTLWIAISSSALILAFMLAPIEYYIFTNFVWSDYALNSLAAATSGILMYQVIFTCASSQLYPYVPAPTVIGLTPVFFSATLPFMLSLFILLHNIKDVSRTSYASKYAC